MVDGPLPDGARRRPARRRRHRRRARPRRAVARPAGGAMMDWSRVFAEKRRLILPIAVAALVNLAVYAVVIYPRTSSAGALEARAQQAAIAPGPRRGRSPRRRGDQDRPGARRRSSWRGSTTACCRKGQDGARRITYCAWRRWPTSRTSTTTGAAIAIKRVARARARADGHDDGARTASTATSAASSTSSRPRPSSSSSRTSALAQGETERAADA